MYIWIWNFIPFRSMLSTLPRLHHILGEEWCHESKMFRLSKYYLLYLVNAQHFQATKDTRNNKKPKITALYIVLTALRTIHSVWVPHNYWYIPRCCCPAHYYFAPRLSCRLCQEARRDVRNDSRCATIITGGSPAQGWMNRTAWSSPVPLRYRHGCD